MSSLLFYIAFLAVAGYAVYVIGSVLQARYAFIKLGRPAHVKVDYKLRIHEFITHVFGQKKLLKDKKSGIMHVVIFYGFIIVQFGAIELIIKGFSQGWIIPLGEAHKYFSLMQEITVAAVLLAIGYALYRRFIEKLKRLKRNFKAAIVVIFICSLMLSVLFSLAFEQLWLGHERSVFTPFSSLLAMAFSGIGETAAKSLFYSFWWMHLIILLSFTIYVPQSKHAHLIFAPINIFFKKLDSPGKLSLIDFEDESVTEYGVGSVEQFRQDQLLDYYSCVECGRCTDVCPATSTGKTLSPMMMIMNMRDHLTDKGAAITSKTAWMPSFAFGGADGNNAIEKKLIGEVVTEEELWACTTCRNCEDACPVNNEHVDMIVDMRRFLVMTEGSMPNELARTFQNIERQGNPWGLNRNERIKWREGMENLVPTVHETDDFDYLFFVGSMSSYDIRSIKIAQATAQLLHHAGVKFAILGNEEKNSGDTARRTGNEFLFQQLAAQNIELFQKYNVKKIVTCDPHTFNTFKNEYPDLGLQAEVYHHTQLLHQLMNEGKLIPTKSVNERITYHDSCYLGRYNGVFEQPRELLRAIPDVELVEMERSGSNAMCCGAGGGMMWMEEKEGTRINIKRTEQAMAVSPTIIISACPYCLTMLSDGIKSKEIEESVMAQDIAEIMLKSVI
ncbi:MAG: succinate dehydrogenase/fumarate reductase iron-sulfur subunit [Bacilli bacterium]|nr:succinate dehydrogenase/fumarate reductase iron-sulfur subunit [Bacilli bacterium]